MDQSCASQKGKALEHILVMDTSPATWTHWRFLSTSSSAGREAKENQTWKAENRSDHESCR